MLRRAQPIALKDDNDTELAERPSLRRNFSALRGDTAPSFDPEPETEPEPAPQPTRFDFDRVAPPPPERRSLDALRTEFQRSLMTPSEGDEGEDWKPRLGFDFSRLRPSRMVLLVVALIAGGAAAWLALQPHEQPATVVAAPVETVKPPPMAKVLVAKAAIGPGQRLSPGALEWQDWPEANVQSQYITEEEKPDALEKMNESAARYAIFPGEPIRQDKLGPAGQGYLSAILDSGTRGVSVSVTPESASGGFIAPNDHVDVVLTRTSDAAQSSETILRDVRVIAIDSHVAETDATATQSAGTDTATVFANNAIATLALDPTQAEVIINATALGRLSLMLRPTADSAATADRSAAETERAANAAIRISSPFWSK